MPESPGAAALRQQALQDAKKTLAAPTTYTDWTRRMPALPPQTQPATPRSTQGAPVPSVPQATASEPKRGLFGALTETLGNITRPFVKSAGLEKHIVDEGKNPTGISALLGEAKGKALNLITAFDELPLSFTAALLGPEAYARQQKLGTGKFSELATKASIREGEDVLAQHGNDRAFIAETHKQLRNSGQRSIQDLAESYRFYSGSAAALESTQQKGSTQVQTVVADPAAMVNDTDTSAYQKEVVWSADTFGRKSDAQTNPVLAAQKYLTEYRGLTEEQANGVIRLYQEETSVLDDIIGKDNAIALRAGVGFAADLLGAGTLTLTDGVIQGGAMLFGVVQKGINNFQNHLALQARIMTDPKFREEMGITGVDVVRGMLGSAMLLPMFKQESWFNSPTYEAALVRQGEDIDAWTMTGDGAIDAIMRFPVSLSRNGGAALGGNIGAAASLGAAAVPVYATTTLLGFSSAVIDASVYKELEEKDKWDFENLGIVSHRAERYLQAGENNLANLDRETRSSLEMQGAVTVDPLNLLIPGISATTKKLIETKAGQKLAWALSPKKLKPENFLKYVEQDARTSLRSMIYGDAKRVSDAFKAGAAKRGLSVKDATRLEYQTEELLRRELQRIGSTVKVADGGELVGILRQKWEKTAQTTVERALDIESKIDHQIDYLLAAERAENVQDVFGQPLVATGLTDITGLGGTRRAMSPTAAEAAAKQVKQTIIEKAEAMARAPDVTDALRAKAESLKTWAKNLSPQDERRLIAADMELRTKGYTLGIGDTASKDYIRVTDTLPNKALRAAQLDAQEIGNTIADLQGLSGQFASLKAEVQKAMKTGNFGPLSGTYLPDLARELRAVTTKSADELYDFIVANKNEDFVTDLLRNHAPGATKLPSRAAIKQLETEIRASLTSVADTIDKIARSVNVRRAGITTQSANSMLRGMELAADKVARLGAFTDEGKRVVEDVLERARNMELDLPTTFHAYVENPNAVKNALGQMLDYTQSILKPFTAVEARRTAMQKLTQTLRDAGLEREELIGIIDKTLASQIDSGILKGFWKRGISSPLSSIASYFGGNTRLVTNLENWSEAFGKLSPAQKATVQKALTETFGHTTAQVYQQMYNMFRFLNPRFMVAETFEQGLANAARHGFGVNYYKAVTDDKLLKYLSDFGDIRVADDFGIFARSPEEIDKALRGVMAVNPKIAKQMKGLIGKVSQGKKQGIEALQEFVGHVRATSFDQSILQVTRSEALRVYKGLPQWDDLLKRYKTEQGVVDALDDFWMDPSMASLDVKKLVIDELGISVEKGQIIKAQIERNVRKRLQQSGSVVASNKIMDTLNHPLVSPFFKYNWRMTKLAVKVFAGHGFGLRYGMGMTYIYNHWSDFSSFDSAKFQREFPEFSRMLQYIFIPANPAKYAPSLGAFSSLLAGDTDGLKNDIVERGFLKPMESGWNATTGSIREIINFWSGYDPSTGRATVDKEAVKSRFLQEALKQR